MQPMIGSLNILAQNIIKNFKGVNMIIALLIACSVNIKENNSPQELEHKNVIDAAELAAYKPLPDNFLQ